MIVKNINEDKKAQAVGKNNVTFRTDVTVRDNENGNVYLDIGNAVGHPSFKTNRKDVLPLLESEKSKSAYSAVKSIWMRQGYLLVGTGLMRKTYNRASDNLKNGWCQVFRVNSEAQCLHCFWFVNNRVYYTTIIDHRKVY